MRRVLTFCVALVGTLVGSTNPVATAAPANVRSVAATLVVVSESPRPDGCADRRTVLAGGRDAALASLDYPAGRSVSVFVYDQVRCGDSYEIGHWQLSAVNIPASKEQFQIRGANEVAIDMTVPAVGLAGDQPFEATLDLDLVISDPPQPDPRVNGTWAGTASGTISGAVTVNLGQVAWTGWPDAAYEFAAAMVQPSNLRDYELGPPAIGWPDVWRKAPNGGSSGSCRSTTGEILGTWEVYVWGSAAGLEAVYAHMDTACTHSVEFVIARADSIQSDGSYTDEGSLGIRLVPGSDVFAGPSALEALGVRGQYYDTSGVVEPAGSMCEYVAAPTDFVATSGVIEPVDC